MQRKAKSVGVEFEKRKRLLRAINRYLNRDSNSHELADELDSLCDSIDPVVTAIAESMDQLIDGFRLHHHLDEFKLTDEMLAKVDRWRQLLDSYYIPTELEGNKRGLISSISRVFAKPRFVLNHYWPFANFAEWDNFKVNHFAKELK